MNGNRPSETVGCGNWEPKYGIGPYCGNCGYHENEHRSTYPYTRVHPQAKGGDAGTSEAAGSGTVATRNGAFTRNHGFWTEEERQQSIDRCAARRITAAAAEAVENAMRTSNLVSQLRGCLEWRDEPLAPDRRVQVIAGHSEEFWNALRLLFAAPPSDPVAWLVKVDGTTIGLFWDNDLAREAAAPITGAVVVPLYEH